MQEEKIFEKLLLKTNNAELIDAWANLKQRLVKLLEGAAKPDKVINTDANV